MPDHAHLFFELGQRLTLSQAVARLKSRTKPALSAADCDWQDNFYDHKLRPEDSIEQVLRYIFLNPYVAHLISPSQQWPLFYCREKDWRWFGQLTDAGAAFPEWLQ